MPELSDLIAKAVESGVLDDLQRAKVSSEDYGTMVKNVKNFMRSEEPAYQVLFGKVGFGMIALAVLTDRRVLFSMCSPGIVHSFYFDDITNTQRLSTVIEVESSDKKMQITSWNPLHAEDFYAELQSLQNDA